MADFKEILKHGANYMVANIATKALAFISIPIYTHLLSTEDFGIVNIFLGVSGILNSLLTLCCDQSVSRYYFDKKDHEDFKQFVGTSSILASIIFLINSAILFVLAAGFGQLVKLETKVVYLLIPYTLVNIIGLTYEQIYTPMRQSKKIAMSSLLRAYMGFSFAVIFIFVFKDAKYLGQIVGLITAGAVMIIIWVRGIYKHLVFSFQKKYLKYILTYSIPLIPYVLSGVIIEQFGKIAIGSTQNISGAGYYSLALTISGLVGIVTAVTHQAWAPYYFEYMNARNYSQHDQDINRIFRITLVAAIGIAAFGKEVGLLLASKEFTSSLHLIPIFAYGFVFHQFSYVYMRNISFVHKTFYLSLIVITAGIINILLNIVFIPEFGEIGAAASFSFSYICMGTFSWAVNKFIIKHHGTPLKILLGPLAIFILFSIPVYFTHNSMDLFLAIFIKAIIVLLFITIMIWPERRLLQKLIRKQ